MDGSRPRGIAVLDAGSTNTKLLLFDHALNVLHEESVSSAKAAPPPYDTILDAPVLELAARTLPAFDAILPVDAVVPCTHGSALALLDADGALALPIMDYNARPPEDICHGYARIAPPFDEVFAPINPGALTLGRQLFWQETCLPDAFGKVRTILPYAQYLAHRLGGRAVSEVTSLGAQTQLWDPRANRPSSLARSRGWDRLFAPRAAAWASVGTLSPRFRGDGFRGRGTICAGIHDSNANYLRYLGGGPDRFALLSTGTWIIGFDGGADVGGLDPAHDVATNSTITGQAVPICRFLGGGEFAIVAGDAADAPCGLPDLARVVRRGVMAIPAFTVSGGPLPGTGGRGHVIGTPATDAERAALASLYCAQMSLEALTRLWGSDPASRVIVDGPFSQNAVYLASLAALLPAARIDASAIREGTAAGAASLALCAADGTPPDLPVDMHRINVPDIPGLSDYHARWQALARG